MGSRLDANTTPETSIFRNEINTLTDFRGGVEVARDFAAMGFDSGHGLPVTDRRDLRRQKEPTRWKSGPLIPIDIGAWSQMP